MIAAIAATTDRIRIGSAGIMLPHYAPFKVAGVFACSIRWRPAA